MVTYLLYGIISTTVALNLCRCDSELILVCQPVSSLVSTHVLYNASIRVHVLYSFFLFCFLQRFTSFTK